MIDMDDDHKDGNERNLGDGCLPIALLAVPLLYVFLLGPAALMYESCPEPMQKGLEIIYSPLEWLDGVIPGRPFSKYIDMWTHD